MADYSKDYYKILGVTSNATEKEIKQAFHNLAFKYHPDRPGGDEKRFKEINEAYQTLANQKSKTEYDTMRKFGSSGGSGFGNQGFNWSNVNFGNNSGFSGFSGFDDIFSSFFNQSFSQQNNRHSRNINSDIEIKIDISFRESFLGGKKDIKYQRIVLCDECNGNGYPVDAKLKTCKNCNGKGYIERERNFPLFGSISEQIKCRTCNGEGKIADKICKHCDGNGFFDETKNETINIPAGIRNGDVLEIKNGGDLKSKKYKAGNLYIHVAVKSDKEFWREGDNLITQININFAEAALGTKKEIKYIDDKILIIDIPKGIAANTTLKIKGKGFKRLNQNATGDLLINVLINTPQKLSKQAEELFKKLKEEL